MPAPQNGHGVPCPYTRKSRLEGGATKTGTTFRLLPGIFDAVPLRKKRAAWKAALRNAQARWRAPAGGRINSAWRYM